jgi:hypothetical protein
MSDSVFSFDSDDLRQSCIDLFRWKPVGAHEAYRVGESQGELGAAMQLLKDAHVEQVADENTAQLRKIEAALNLEEGALDAQYSEYLRLLGERQERIDASQRAGASCMKPWTWCGPKRLKNVDTLSKKNRQVWGSVRQVKSGKVVVDTLHKEGVSRVHLHPIFGALLRPTGGIVGSGNRGRYEGKSTDALVMHGAVHDAAGYLHTYHDVGPGYNYTDGFSFHDTTHRLSGQGAGLAYWARIVEDEESQ